MPLGIWLGALLVIAAIGTCWAWVSDQTRRQAIEAAERDTANIARALDQSTARAMGAADMLIRAVAARIEAEDADQIGSLWGMVSDLASVWKHVSALTVLDAHTGAQLFQYSGDYPVTSEIDDQGYYSSAMPTGRELSISLPIYNEALRRWTVGVSRRVALRTEPYDIVVVAHLDLSYFDHIADGLQLGPQGTVALFRTDGILLSRRPVFPGSIGRNLSSAALFTHLAKAPSGTYETAVATDGVLRIISYRKLENLPLVILCGFSKEDVLTRWREHMQTIGALSALLVLIVLALMAWLTRVVRRRDQMAAALTATLQNIDQGLIMVDEGGTVQVYNRRVADLLGLPDGLLEGRPGIDAIRDYQLRQGEFAEADDSVRRWAMTAEIGQERHTYERRRPNGTVLEITNVPLPFGGAVRTYTDVTIRRKAEAAVAESERRYRLLADNSSDVIILKQPGGERTYVSPACRAILGYEPEEFQSIPREDLVHPDDLADVDALFASLTLLHPPATHVHRLKHRAGYYVWVELVVSLVRDARGQPIFLGAIRDVSERQRQEEELRAAKEAAEQANRAKSDFLASMSHEIRTPLNSILGFTGLLLDRPFQGEERRQLQLIQSSGSALLTLVNDILDFSKIEAGQVELDPQAFALSSLVHDTVAIIRGLAAEKEIEISVGLPPDVPAAVVGDADRLRQILLNYLNNAVKFTRKGYVGLSVAVLDSGPAGERLRFSVTDTGIGIPKDKQSRLFERFSQVDGSISRAFGGTGLGLAICKRLVELMGGTVGVQSEPGVGSTFWFDVTLPRADLAALQPAALPASAVAEAGTARILLAEDLDINQELAELILTRAGHQVDIVQNGAEAVQAVERSPYDMVLMDIQMPVMDGVTAAERIRSLSGPVRHIPIIALTANVLPEQVARFRAAGMNDHVGKPFRAAELLEVVRRWLPDILIEESGDRRGAA